MGLRCLLGHDFGEPELQREREEDGDEVVTTVKEVKTCARCGETQIVSENTEVTTMEQLADEAAANATGETDPAGEGDRGTAGGPAAPGEGEAAVDADGTAGVGAAPGRGDADEAAGAGDGVTLDEEPGAGTDDAVIIDDGPSGDEGTETADAGPDPGEVETPTGPADGPDAAGESASTGPSRADEDTELLDAGEGSASGGSPATDAEPESASSAEPDAESDDGVILDEDGESAGDRERGAWPSVDEADADADERAAWPDNGGEDEGFSAEVGEGGEADVEFGGGLTPEAAAGRDGESAETEYVEAPDDAEAVAFDAGGEGGTGITRGESPDLETAGGDEPTEYYCPECGMVRAADGSSMRAGDICPECKRGYVDERPR
ncbi:putative RNA-binding Zn-ribbon protein involved in translation (DUF1610 family) [Halorubrum trapanicum]|uniref:Putative RNA-binding Zn-ribbon protein involved in translation (DUF1610 family) n=1 Tax=Halorubrum trapanicum TaxID=29284 RepID=A0A8J7REL6_9EURY|nr:hypothetical protein [Halorubrum trapanicum]MBP1902728.1 putative RNA-binding Zn-ribbon protein involved in translation (DUF1610 family) [Halorubrum trapanicum]